MHTTAAAATTTVTVRASPSPVKRSHVLNAHVFSVALHCHVTERHGFGAPPDLENVRAPAETVLYDSDSDVDL